MIRNVKSITARKNIRIYRYTSKIIHQTKSNPSYNPNSYINPNLNQNQNPNPNQNPNQISNPGQITNHKSKS